MTSVDNEPHALHTDPPEDLVAELIAALQPFDPNPITRDRGKAMERNLGDVLVMLSDWRREDAAASAVACPPLPSIEPPSAPPVPPKRRPKRRKFPAETS